jgi:WD40 repeat protein
MLASSGQDGTVRVWSPDRVDPITTLWGSDIVPTSSFKPVSLLVALGDGRFASGAYDGAVRVWSPDQPYPVAILRGHEPDSQGHKRITALVSLPDGRLASAGEDGTIRLWVLDPKRLLHLASTRAGRNLSANEWRLYFGENPYRRTFPEWPLGDGVEKAVMEGRLRLFEEATP